MVYQLYEGFSYFLYRNRKSRETRLLRPIHHHLDSVKESVNVKMTTAIIYSSRFILRGLQKRQRK
jgi:hypothetical protein